MRGYLLSGMLCVILSYSHVASAGTIDMTFASTAGREDTYGLSVNYVGGHLSITGTNVSVTIQQPNGSITKPRGVFNLQADVSSTGVLSNASISLVLNSSQVIWNSSQFVDFGFNSDLSELDFKFVQSGPSYLQGIGDGTLSNVIIFRTSGTAPAAGWGWHTDFSYVGKNDGGAAVPLPGVAAAGIGLFGVVGRRSWFARGRRAVVAA
jgi:hypothetical protein